MTLQPEQQAWVVRWPNHCTKCHGWGGIAFTEMHGFTHGSGEQLFDHCECTETKCPRCGTVGGLSEDSEGPCSACGWNYDDGFPSFAFDEPELHGPEDFWD